MASTAKQISEAIKARKLGIPFPVASLDITIRLKPPKVSDVLSIRKLEGELAQSEQSALETVIEIMVKAIAVCTGRSDEDAEILFIEDGFERGELGRKCLEICGCNLSMKVLQLAERTVLNRDDQDHEKESKDNGSEQIFK